jgi:hypothetical protein
MVEPLKNKGILEPNPLSTQLVFYKGDIIDAVEWLKKEITDRRNMFEEKRTVERHELLIVLKRIDEAFPDLYKD